MYQRYYELGPTARICLEFSDEDIVEFKSRRRDAINKTLDLAKLLSDVIDDAWGSVPNSALNSYVDPMGSFSHKICLIRRSVVNQVSSPRVVHPMSASAIQEILLELQNRDEQGILILWRIFSKLPDAQGMVGMVFEAFLHQIFRQSIVLTAQRMFPHSYTSKTSSISRTSRYHMLSSDYEDKPRLQNSKDKFLKSIPKVDIHINIDTIPHECVLYEAGLDRSPTKITLKEDVYYQPKSGQQVGIDAFFIHRSYLYLLQYTVEASCGINDKLMEFLPNTFDSLPPLVKWRFIFVIPDSLKKFSSRPDSVISSVPSYTATIQMQ